MIYRLLTYSIIEELWHTYEDFEDFARAIESDVLHSEQVQAWKRDAERYRYIKKGNQWIVAATQTGFHVDGEQLDSLIDAEKEQQKNEMAL